MSIRKKKETEQSNVVTMEGQIGLNRPDLARTKLY